MEKLYVADVRIVRGHDDRAQWVHSCDETGIQTHLPLSIQHCTCGAELHTSAAVRLPCFADLVQIEKQAA
jgi:hypothetical protein